jgi:hypothetical protein
MIDINEIQIIKVYNLLKIVHWSKVWLSTCSFKSEAVCCVRLLRSRLSPNNWSIRVLSRRLECCWPATARQNSWQLAHPAENVGFPVTASCSSQCTNWLTHVLAAVADDPFLLPARKREWSPSDGMHYHLLTPREIGEKNLNAQDPLVQSNMYIPNSTFFTLNSSYHLLEPASCTQHVPLLTLISHLYNTHSPCTMQKHPFI